MSVETLNDEQRAAVQSTARHALVIAGAGSGKTRTLTHRVAWLLEHGVPGWRILLLTFTNKAAREMLSRVSGLVGEAEAGGIWGGTFHSVANRLLRRYAELLGYQPGFTILDSDDQRALFRALVKQYTKGMSKAAAFPKPEVVSALHSLAANTARPWQDTLLSDYPHLARHEETLSRIYTDYAQRKLATNAMDFDDLLLNLLRLLTEHSDVREELQRRFRHVLVDEYQDTNALQERIISLLCGGEHTSLMVVGDDAQSIYSWRGAQVEHIIHFPRRYPGAEVYKIETNYRSVPAILDISNAAIACNERQVLKTLRPARKAGRMLPVITPAADNRLEALGVARRIDELMERGIPGKDIAVLYRAHFHSLDVQMELTRAHIPYRITSGLRFFEQAHIKDVVAYLRLVANPRDEVAFLRLVSTLPRVGEAGAAKMWRQWQDARAAAPAPEGPWQQLMSRVSVPAAARTGWLAILSTLDSLRAPAEGADSPLPPAEMVRRVQSAIQPYICSAYENDEQRMEDIEQLAHSLADTATLEDFLSQVALLTEADRDTEAAADEDCVTLSTIHQAKGLEWRVVFVIFLAEGMFPHYRVLNSGDTRELEEETRLFYVAVTRAEDELYLSYPRYNGHGYDRTTLPPSRFLTSLPNELYEVE